MCDYSLHHVATRPAKLEDKLVTTKFTNSITRGFAAVGESKAEVEALWLREWNNRSPIQWVEHSPPRQKRPDERPQQDKVIEHDAISYASLAKRFHPDLLDSKRRFSAHEIMQIVNELRGAK